MKFIIGKKIEMIQAYDDLNNVIPATRVLATPCVVSQIRTKEKDGYSGVQLACQEKKKLKKAQAGHLKKMKKYGVLREFRLEDFSAFKQGQEIKVSVFEPGDLVSATGFSKGRGFQGVVKRYNFKGASATHGTKDQLRMTGSIGATGPAHVIKGKKMPGRMGHQKVTVKNLEIIQVDKNNNEIVIRGALPGPRHEIIMIMGSGQKTRKKEEVKVKEAKVKKSAKKESTATKEGAPEEKTAKETKEVKKDNK